jgi:hypothetical protein
MDNVRIKAGAPTSKGSIDDGNPTLRFAAQLRALLEKEFPGTLRADDLPATDRTTIELRPGSDSISFSLGFASAKYARLAWLDRLRRIPERLSLGGEGVREIALPVSDDSTMFVSAENGFVTRIERRTATGPRVGVQLVSVQIDAPVPDSEFELPETGEGVQDTSEELADIMEGQALSASRDELYGAIARFVDDARLPWSAEMPARIERVMCGLHAVDFAPVCARLLAERKAAIEKVAAAVREQKKSLDLHDPATLAEQTELMQQARRKLEDTLAQFLDREVTQGMPRGTCKLRPGLYEELGALDKRILSEAFAEAVTKPVLAAFDEQVAKQLEAK